MIEHVYRHRVRYREVDPMSVVYHAHYVDYFEAARTEALRAHGLPYKALEDAGIIMPVVDLNVRYLLPARYDELLEVTVRFPETPTVRVRAEYEVRRAGDPTLLVTGTVVLCFFDTVRRRPIRAPQPLLDVFARADSPA
ncbi:MAG: thioesterase family protein [Rhodothermales bacterium]